MVGEEAGEVLKQTFSMLETREVWHSSCVSWVWLGKGERGRKTRHQIGRCCYLPSHYLLPIAKHASFWHQTGWTVVSGRCNTQSRKQGRVSLTAFLVLTTLRIGGSRSDSLSSIIVCCGRGASTLVWPVRRGCAEERRRLGWRKRGVNVEQKNGE